MALTANAIPSVHGGVAVPFDASLAFCSAAVLTASGYLGSPTTLDLGLGRQSGMAVFDVTAEDVASGDENYRFFLLGSNDAAFGNGNVELLGMREVGAASAGRIIPTILGASPTIPNAGRAGAFVLFPFITLGVGGIIYRYVRGYVQIGGTTPTTTITAWLTVDNTGGGR